jgi:hypothetical protein
VVQIEQQIAAAREEERERADNIAAMCNIAGFPDMIQAELKARPTLAELREKLEKRKLEEDASRKIDAIDTSQDRKRRDVHAELAKVVEQRFASQRGGTEHRS